MSALPPDRPGCPKTPGGRRPLPDAAAIRLCLVPDSAPPYDDDVPAAQPPGRGGGGEDKARPAWAGEVDPGRREPAPGESVAEAALGWPSRFAQVLAETLAGSRPARQIVPWTTQQARDHIQRLGPRMASGQRPRVRRVVTFRPAADVMEMAVVVGFGPRVRALAIRLERSGTCPPAGRGAPADQGAPAGQGALTGRGESAGRPEPDGRWLCTAVEAA